MTNTTATTIGQLYKQQGKDIGVTVKKEFAVPFDAIYITPGFNAKDAIYRDVVEGMKNTLRKGGYLPKMIVEPQPCGTRFELIAGQHRYHAYKELIEEGMDFRRVTVEGFKGTAAEKVVTMMKENEGRQFTPVQRANAWGRLVEQFGWTRQEIVDEFATNMSTVTHHMAIFELSDRVKAYISEGRIAADYAVELNRKGGEQAVINVVENAGQKKATRTSTNAWRPVNGRNVCVLLKSVNIRREGDHMVARFTGEEWEKIQAVLETLGSDGEGK